MTELYNFDSGETEHYDDTISSGFGLDIFYSHQFVQNETLNLKLQEGTQTVYEAICRTPILSGTTTGTVYSGSYATHTFVINSEGNFTFSPVGCPQVSPVKGHIDLMSGVINLLWNEVPASSTLVVSYEYNMTAEKEEPRPVRKVEGVTFEKFFDHDEIDYLLRNAHTVCAWDFHCALGDTIREKYESLEVKVVELTNVLIRKGAAGYFWLVAPPEIAAIFETATYRFWPADKNESGKLNGQFPMGTNEVLYSGLLKSRWRIYTDQLMPANQVLIGVNDSLEDLEHYARMTVANFII